tara:strand:+ start:8409 stop:9233 length:825 start_codon:yes stop_codon:yes gene_type:complete
MSKKRTNFPGYGDNEKISISNSRFKQFDYEYALKLKKEYPKIWKMAGTGGNPPTSFTGDDAFRLWGKYRAGERTPSVLSWIKRREKFASRHYKNTGLKGAIAHVKWGTVNSSGVSGMKKVINEQKKKINQRKSKSLLIGDVDCSFIIKNLEKEYSKKNQTLVNRVKEHNEKYGKDPKKRVTYRMLLAVFRRGIGAYKTNPGSVRPHIRSAEEWAYARVKSFLYVVRNGRFRSGKHDTDLLPSKHRLSSKNKNLNIENFDSSLILERIVDQLFKT